MAPSPEYQKEAELIIADAMEDWQYDHDRGVIGARQVTCIADRLREAGYLNDQDEPYIGWDRYREHRAERNRKYARNERPD